MFLLQISIDGPTAGHPQRGPAGAGGGNNFAGHLRPAWRRCNAAKAGTGNKLPLIGGPHHHIPGQRAASLWISTKISETRWTCSSFTFPGGSTKPAPQAHEEDFAGRFGFTPKLHRGWVGDWTIKETALLDAQLKEVLKRSKGFSAPAVNIIPNITGVENLREYYTDHSANYGYDKCISIYQAVEIDSNGDMSPCRDYHDYVVGNVKEQTISQIWNNAAYRKFRSSLCTKGLMPVCTRCCGLMGY